MINTDLKKRFPANTQLNEEERNMLSNMLEEEKNKVRKMLPKDAVNRAVTDASFIRELIKKEYKERSRMYSKSK